MLDVSVIIPCFNNGAYIKEAIESVLSQKGGVREIIVVDDGSTDDSVAIARSYSQIHVIEQANQGACVARNRGLSESSAPFVKFLDADDWLVDGALSAQVKLLEHLPENQCVFGRALWVDSGGEVLGTFPEKPIEDEQVLKVDDLLKCVPLTSCPLHRRIHLERVGGFDSRCLRGQEHDLHVRLALSGVEFVYQNQLIYYYRQHTGAGRISAHDHEEKVLKSKFDASQRHCELAEQIYPEGLPEGVRRPLAHYLWRNGRQCVLANAPQLAYKNFYLARSLAGHAAVVGSTPYRILTRFFGPILAERIAKFLQQLR